MGLASAVLIVCSIRFGMLQVSRGEYISIFFHNFPQALTLISSEMLPKTHIESGVCACRCYKFWKGSGPGSREVVGNVSLRSHINHVE